MPLIVEFVIVIVSASVSLVSMMNNASVPPSSPVAAISIVPAILSTVPASDSPSASLSKMNVSSPRPPCRVVAIVAGVDCTIRMSLLASLPVAPVPRLLSPSRVMLVKAAAPPPPSGSAPSAATSVIVSAAPPPPRTIRLAKPLNVVSSKPPLPVTMFCPAGPPLSLIESVVVAGVEVASTTSVPPDVLV